VVQLIADIGKIKPANYFAKGLGGFSYIDDKERIAP
jgi:hypothetical protein